MKKLCWFSLLLLSTSALAERENAILVLDASGSMWGQIDGRSKVEIARDAVGGLLNGWNQEHHLGLIAYGHNRRGDCEDIELLIPPGPLDAQAFRRTVNGLNARGMTPLAAAVRQAAAALQSSEQKATVILVSDGEENCGLDPCAIGAELATQGLDFTAHVIGFDLGDPAREAGLRCLAESTGGLYFSASDAAGLNQALGAVAAMTTEAVRPGGSASLEAPNSAVEGSLMTISYRGPAERGDYIDLVDARGHSRASVWVPLGVEQGEVVIKLPAAIGDFQLRYVGVLREPSLLAERALELTPAEALIEAPENVPQGGLVSIRVRGPVDAGENWVTIAARGSSVGTYLRWQHLSEPEQEMTLLAPSEPGEYEIRFILAGAESPLVSRPLRVSPAEILIDGPPEVAAGESFDVRAVGPRHEEFWITIVEADASDGEYRSWAYLSPATERYQLTAPSAPGAYELRYVLTNPFAVMARQPIQVTAAVVSWAAPDSVRIGEAFEFSASGPSAEGAYITVVPAGSADGHYEAWQWIDPSGDYQWTAPGNAGAWELRYMLGDGSVAARRALRVDP